MKVRVVKAFSDSASGGRTRFEGTIYETTLKRAAELNLSGHVVLLEEPKEYNVPKPPGETKKPGRKPGFTKVNGKNPVRRSKKLKTK